MNKRIISPSLLSADFSILKEEIDIVVNSGANRLHLDVMDGHFVPNFTFGPFIVKAIRKLTNAHLETHLMISNPHKYLQDFQILMIWKKFYINDKLCQHPQPHSL